MLFSDWHQDSYTLASCCILVVPSLAVAVSKNSMRFIHVDKTDNNRNVFRICWSLNFELWANEGVVGYRTVGLQRPCCKAVSVQTSSTSVFLFISWLDYKYTQGSAIETSLRTKGTRMLAMLRLIFLLASNFYFPHSSSLFVFVEFLYV